MAEYLDINIVVDTSKPIFASHSAICRMGDPVLIYQATGGASAYQF